MTKQLLLLACGLLLTGTTLARPTDNGPGNPVRKAPAARLAMPTLECPSSRTLNFSSVLSSDNATSNPNTVSTECQKIIQLAAATDNSGILTSYTLSFSAGNPVPTTLPMAILTGNTAEIVNLGRGQTLISIVGTDPDGNNVSTCAYTITMVDNVPPDLSSSPSSVSAQTTTTMPDLRNLMVVTETCDYTLTQAPAPGSAISGPSVSVTFVATDASGNQSTPHLLTLNLTATTPYDNMTLTAAPACLGDPENINVTLSGLPVSTLFKINYQLDGVAQPEQNPTSDGAGVVTFPTDYVSGGTHQITIVSIEDQTTPTAAVLLTRSTSVYIGTPEVGMLAASGLLCAPNLFVSGGTVLISATATAGATYRWYKDGTLLPGQAATTLTLTNVQVSNAGNYELEASTGCFSATSTPLNIAVGGVEPSLVVTLPNGSTVNVVGQFPTITLPAGQVVNLLASGGASYDWRLVLRRDNSYELRQVEQNTTGQIRITEPGLYRLLVKGANGCERVFEGLIKYQ